MAPAAVRDDVGRHPAGVGASTEESTGAESRIPSVDHMTTHTQKPIATSTGRTTALTLIAAIAVTFAACWIIALAAVAAGATAFPPLTPYAFGTFVVIGVLVGHLGWRVVRRFAPAPRRVLQVLVPAVLALSFIPDVALLAIGFIPGTTVAGAIALMLMHLVVAAVVVPVSQRVAPV